MSKKLLIAVVGATASGKTGLSIELAQHFDCPIISMDSRQIYREMNIGTAVPTQEELKAAKHYFIQTRSIHEDYSAGNYAEDAGQLLKELFNLYHTVVAVGGSGLYIKALIDGLDDFPEVTDRAKEIVKEWMDDSDDLTALRQLEKLDPDYYHQVDKHNSRRVQRALEVCVTSGKPFSSFRKNQTTVQPFETLFIAADIPRELLYQRINDRVDQMMKNGLLEEARSLYPFRDKKSLQTVGYRELFLYFDGEISLDKAVEEIKKNTRRYAKRQLTWLRSDQRVWWVDFRNTKQIVKRIEENLGNM